MSDTLVLKNTKFTKGLVMPKKGTYLELDQDEMEYVDGGYTISYRLFAGLTIHFDRWESKAIADAHTAIALYSGGIAVVCAIFPELISKAGAVALGVISLVCSIYASVFQNGANGAGTYLSVRWAIAWEA